MEMCIYPQLRNSADFIWIIRRNHIWEFLNYILVSLTVNHESYQCPQLKTHNRKLKQVLIKWIMKNVNQFLIERKTENVIA